MDPRTRGRQARVLLSGNPVRSADLYPTTGYSRPVGKSQHHATAARHHVRGTSRRILVPGGGKTYHGSRARPENHRLPARMGTPVRPHVGNRTVPASSRHDAARQTQGLRFHTPPPRNATPPLADPRPIQARHPCGSGTNAARLQHVRCGRSPHRHERRSESRGRQTHPTGSGASRRPRSRHHHREQPVGNLAAEPHAGG